MIHQYKISRWEKVFGGDLWRLRNLLRRVVSVPFALIPVRSWRHKARDYFDRWIISWNKDKIAHFVKFYPSVNKEIETVKNIAKNGYSIARFGDGEFNMCIGRDKSFQNYNRFLVDRLIQVLNCEHEGLLIGINTIASEEDLTDIWKKFVVRRGNRVLNLLDPTRTYESSTITTVFPKFENEFQIYVDQLKMIWDKRKVVFVVGKESRFFYEKELFDNIECYEFIYGPAKNAYDVYDVLMAQIMKYGHDWLIMISLGPTATVMAHDLHLKGYQAIDLGQTPSKYHKAKYGTLYPTNK